MKRKVIKLHQPTAPLHGVRDYMAAVIASAGIGFIPIASGTFASLVAAVFWFVIADWSPWRKILLWIVAALLGVWAAGRLIRCWGPDPARVVIDEIVGQWLALVIVPTIPVWYFVSFIIFRCFDIVKPFPIRRIEQWRGGWGVIADDILAALYTILIFFILQRIGIVRN